MLMYNVNTISCESQKDKKIKIVNKRCEKSYVIIF